MNEKILVALKELREKSKKRNFSQSFDLIINLKEFDTKKPENKFSENIILPYGRGKDAEVAVFSDSIKSKDYKIFTSIDVDRISKNKREAKNLASRTDFFLAEPKMMPLIGKSLGCYLAPRGKMPTIISGDEKSTVQNLKKTIRIVVKDSPVIQSLIGKENMKDEEIVENIEAILKFLETKLPKGKRNIGKVLLKLTMCKPVKLEV